MAAADLRLAVDKAKAATCRPDRIKYNIDKASGNLDGLSYEEIRYEGYGIAGAAIIVDCMTDNRGPHRGRGAPRLQLWRQPRHRRLGGLPVQALRQFIFAPGTSGRQGDGRWPLEAGAEDVVTGDDGAIEVLTAPADFEAVKAALEAAGLNPEVAEVTMRPENTIDICWRRRPSVCRSCSTCSKTWTTFRTSITTPLGLKAGMKVLVLGNGGREHALAWKLAQSPGSARSSWRRAMAARRATRNSRTSRSPTEATRRLRRRAEGRADGRRPRGYLAAGAVDEFRARACASLAPPRRPRSWRAPRPSPRPSCEAPRHPHRPPTRPLPTPPPLTPMWTRKAPPS